MFVACGCTLLAGSAFATPAEEIARAVAANGVVDVSQARPRQFMKAFIAVAFRAHPRDLPQYVNAAINLRPDLAPNTVAVAVKAAVKNWETKPEAVCVLIEQIVRAAIAANPDSAASIARAGASAAPTLVRCTINAAIAAAPESKDEILAVAGANTLSFAFLTFSASTTDGISFSAATLNPANISEPSEDGAVNSPEQPASP